MFTNKKQSVLTVLYNGNIYKWEVCANMPHITNFAYIVYKSKVMWTDGKLRWGKIRAEIKNFSPGALNLIKKIIKQKETISFCIEYVDKNEKWVLDSCCVEYGNGDNKIIITPNSCELIK